MSSNFFEFDNFEPSQNPYTKLLKHENGDKIHESMIINPNLEDPFRPHPYFQKLLDELSGIPSTPKLQAQKEDEDQIKYEDENLILWLKYKKLIMEIDQGEFSTLNPKIMGKVSVGSGEILDVFDGSGFKSGTDNYSQLQEDFLKNYR